MMFSPFYLLFPKIAIKETRNIYLSNHRRIPDGMYALLPSYCMDKQCDCRRAFVAIHKIEEDGSQSPALATLSYGWEDLSFYEAWGTYIPEDMIKEMKGPCLERIQSQSENAEDFLEIFENRVLADQDFIERLKRHYAYFKQKKGMRLPADLQKLITSTAPCPCGSEKILRRCCLRQRSSSRGRKKRKR